MNVRWSFILLWSLQQTFAVLIPNLVYVKVQNIFFDLATINLLSNTSGVLSGLRCLSWCSSTSDCTLSCYNGNYCFLSSALVSPYWVPSAGSVLSFLTYSDYKCYSNWIFENDLTSQVYSATGSAQEYASKDAPSYTIDGYYADTKYATYLSNTNDFPWIQLDMGKPFTIQKIIIKTCGNDEISVFFDEVEARVGNESFNSNYVRNTKNSIFAHYTGPPNYGDVVTLISSAPVVGRYITLQRLNEDKLRIGEIKIIGF